MQSHTGHTCLTFLHCALSNVSSNWLPLKMKSHIDCMSSTFPQVWKHCDLIFYHCAFLNILSNCLPLWRQSHIGCIYSTFSHVWKSHRLHLFDFLHYAFSTLFHPGLQNYTNLWVVKICTTFVCWLFWFCWGFLTTKVAFIFPFLNRLTCYNSRNFVFAPDSNWTLIPTGYNTLTKLGGFWPNWSAWP